MIPIVQNASSFSTVSTTPSKSKKKSQPTLADDVESQISSTTTQDEASWKGNNSATSPITYKSPRRTRAKHALRGSPVPFYMRKAKRTPSGNNIPRELPLGSTAKVTKQPKPPNTMMDRVLDSVEQRSDSCQLYPEPEISVAMKKRVMIDERQNVRVSPTHPSIACTTIPPAISPSAKSPKSILKRSLRFGVRPNKKQNLGTTPSPPSRQSRAQTTQRDGPMTVAMEHIEYEGDLLDYIFDSVENFLCRQDDHGTSFGNGPPPKHLEKGSGSPNNDDPDQLERLYKVPSHDSKEIIRTKQKDALDYIFECGGNDHDDEELRIYPTPAKDRDLLDYMFECGDDSTDREDSRDASFRAPQSPHGLGAALAMKSPNEDTNSIILNASSSSSNDGHRIGRAEILRQKKRQIEEKRRLIIRGEQRRYVIPKGCEDDTTTRTMIISQVSSDALSQAQHDEDQLRRNKRMFMAGLVMTIVGVVLVVIAISFFFPVRA